MENKEAIYHVRQNNNFIYLPIKKMQGSSLFSVPEGQIKRNDGVHIKP